LSAQEASTAPAALAPEAQPLCVDLCIMADAMAIAATAAGDRL